MRLFLKHLGPSNLSSSAPHPSLRQATSAAGTWTGPGSRVEGRGLSTPYVGAPSDTLDTRTASNGAILRVTDLRGWDPVPHHRAPRRGGVSCFSIVSYGRW